ncbi:MAG: hypothetical protein QHH13_06310 [Melioribacter sp.]|uniref:hypothetical protein n=1 Tax=Rosettibacter primus TaxID=3111523 RepID=UPI00247E682D|nr:hypothetical protein [Melioribacter sp.]
MKKLMSVIIFVFIFFLISYAQEREQMFEKRFDDRKILKKIEQLEKSKLIELLNLDEDTSIRFFARRNEHQKKIKLIFDEREKIIQDLKKNLDEEKRNDAYYKEQVSKLIDLENKMCNERENYYKSLSSILQPQQIAKLAVFEFMFRKELTHSIFRKMPKDK